MDDSQQSIQPPSNSQAPDMDTSMHYAPGLPLSGEPIGPGGFIRPEDQEDSGNEGAWDDVMKDKDQEEEEEEEEEGGNNREEDEEDNEEDDGERKGDDKAGGEEDDEGNGGEDDDAEGEEDDDAGGEEDDSDNSEASSHHTPSNTPPSAQPPRAKTKEGQQITRNQAVSTGRVSVPSNTAVNRKEVQLKEFQDLAQKCMSFLTFLMFVSLLMT